MFARISVTALLALPLLATATVLPRGGGDGAACTATGTAQCCDTTQSVSLSSSCHYIMQKLTVIIQPTDLTAPVSTLLGLFGVVVGQLTGNVYVFRIFNARLD